MRKLIIDLLDLTRLESGQKQREKIDVNLCELANTAFDINFILAKEREIEMVLECDEDAIIKADRGEMEIIMNNLVSNAVKYNRDKGTVTVTIQRRQNRIIWTVTDTGIGMSQTDAEKVFEEFYRAKNIHTRNILGSGLGLSVVKKIVTLYQGDITVESKENVGSTFKIIIDSDPVVNLAMDTGSLAFLGGR